MSEFNKKDEKKFIFPENVDSSYGVFLGLTVKELVFYVLPMLTVGIIVLFIPPHSLKFTVIKAITIVLIMTFLLAVLSSRPVSSRPNIRLLPHMQMKAKYKTRQHLFFKQPKVRK